MGKQFKLQSFLELQTRSFSSAKLMVKLKSLRLKQTSKLSITAFLKGEQQKLKKTAAKLNVFNGLTAKRLTQAIRAVNSKPRPMKTVAGGSQAQEVWRG